MEERIKFEVLLYIYKGLHGQNPSYLKEAMGLYIPGHAGLRSNLDTTRLVTPKHATLVIGDRSFFNAEPRLWNFFPAAIRSAQSIKVFTKQFKHNLFAESYPIDWLHLHFPLGCIILHCNSFPSFTSSCFSQFPSA